MTYEGFEHIERAARRRASARCCACPHLGGWEWSGLLADPGAGASRSPPSSSASSRRSCSTGSSASASARHAHRAARPRRRPGDRGRGQGAATSSPCCATATSPAAASRSTFFGERTTLPVGPGRPRPAHRRAAAARPRSTTEGRDHHGVVRPPVPAERAGHVPRRRRPHHPGPGRRARGADPAGARAVAPDAAQLAERPRRLGARSGSEPARRLRVGSGRRAQYPDAVRIGLVCPYSLTVPGGVQGQVLGLARALRALGHDARVLGPVRRAAARRRRHAARQQRARPRPTARSPRSPPTRRPSCAPSGRCATRRSTSLHLHEPLAPGPDHDRRCCSATRRWSARSTPPGDSAAYAVPEPRRPVAGQAARHPLRGVGGRRGHGRAGPRRQLRAAVQRHRGRAVRQGRPRRRPTGPTIFFVGRHEPRKGLAVLLDALRHLPRRRRGCGSAATGPRPRRCGARHGGDPRIEWLGRLSDDEKAARMRGADVFCAPSLHGESFGVVLLEAMAAGRRVVACDLAGYAQRGRPTASTPCSCRPATPRRWPPRCGRVLGDGGLRRRAGRRGRAAGRGVLDGRASPSATSSSTSASPPAAADRAAGDRGPARPRPPRMSGRDRRSSSSSSSWCCSCST